MYRHDLPVSQDGKRAARRRAFTDADADGRARCHVNLHVSLETQGKGKKCKFFSPLQVCDMTSLGRWVFVCERVEEMVKRGIQGARWHRFANSSCPHVLFFPSFFRWKDMVAMLQQWMEESQENVATTPFPPPPFFLVFLPPFLPQYSMTEEYIMQHFFFFFCHPHFWVPPRSSCLVRLQVVWQQDLQKRTRAGNTPWLTWLLRGRNWRNRNAKTQFLF